MKNYPPKEKIKEMLDYDPESGVFKWRVYRGRTAKPGYVAGGHDTHGYRRIKVCGIQLGAHRIAWMLVHGDWPPDCIDHINGNVDDNRIANLRAVSIQTNNQNQRKAQAHNRSSGLLGSTFHKKQGLWHAQIRFNGTNKHLGRFATAEEAHKVYVLAKRELHPGNTL